MLVYFVDFVLNLTENLLVPVESRESQIVQICEMCRCDPENFRLGDMVTELKISNLTVMLFFHIFTLNLT